MPRLRISVITRSLNLAPSGCSIQIPSPLDSISSARRWPGKPSRSELLLVEQLPDWYPQRDSQRLYCVQRRISLPALDPAHVAPGVTAFVRKCFLRPTLCFTQSSDAIAKSSSERGTHAPDCVLSYTYRPRTNRDKSSASQPMGWGKSNANRIVVSARTIRRPARSAPPN